MKMEIGGQFYAWAVLPPGKETRYLLDGRLHGLQSWSTTVAKRKKSLPLTGIEPTPFVQPIAELHRS